MTRKAGLCRQVCYFTHFIPEMGAHPISRTYLRDYIDVHANITPYWTVPAFFNRKDVSMKALIKYGK